MSNRRAEGLPDLLRHLGRLKRLVEIGLNGDGRSAVAPPKDRVLGPDFHMADLAQRHELAVAAVEAEIGEPGGIEAVRSPASRNHVHGADILAHLSDRNAAKQELELLGSIARIEPDQPQSILVEDEVNRRHPLAPVEVDLAGMRVGAHHRRDLGCDGAQHRGIGPHHPEIDEIAREWPKEELGHPEARLRSEALGDSLAKPELESAARCGVGSEDDQLGEGRVGQLRIVGEEEARRPLADVGRDDFRLGLSPHPGLDLGGRCCGRFDARAFGHLDLDQHFGPVGAREELLLDQPHANAGDEERADHEPGDQELAVDRPGDEASKPLIARRRVDCGAPARDGLDIGQELDAEIRREHDCHEPRGEQSEADDPEDVAGIFAGGRAGEADRREADHGDQGSGEHRRGGMGPGVGGRPGALEAFLHLHHHHLDRDDRVIHQKPERDDQCAKRDPVEYAAGPKHDDEDCGKGQRHGRSNDNADSPAKADQAHHHDHRQSDEEFEHELVHRLVDVHRLVGDLGESEPGRKRLGDLLLFGLERPAQVKPVPAILHNDAEHERGLPIVPDQECRRILIAALHIGDVGELEDSAARGDRRVPDFLQVVISAVQADEHLRPIGVDRSCGSHCILPCERVEDVARADAEGGKPRIREFDEDALGALPEDIDLLDAGDVQQALAERFGLACKQARRQAMRFERIKGKGDVGIFVVDERPLDSGREPSGLVAKLLSRLVELLGHCRGRSLVAERQGHQRHSGTREGLDPIVPAQLLHALFERLRDQVLHLLRGCARPHRGDRQILDREGRILGPAEPRERIDPGKDDRNDQEQGDCPLPNRERGQIEAAHLSAASVAATRTSSPSCRRCPPRATIRLPGVTPAPRIARSLSSRSTCTGRKETDEALRLSTQTPGP